MDMENLFKKIQGYGMYINVHVVITIIRIELNTALS